MSAREVWAKCAKEHEFYVDWLLRMGAELFPEDIRKFRQSIEENFIAYLVKLFIRRRATQMMIKLIANLINIEFCIDRSIPSDDIISPKLVFTLIGNHPNFNKSNELDDCANCMVTYVGQLDSDTENEDIDYFSSFVDEVSQLNGILDPKISFKHIIDVFSVWESNDRLFQSTVRSKGCFFQFLVDHVSTCYSRGRLSKTKHEKVLKSVYRHIKGFISKCIVDSKTKAVTGERVLQDIGSKKLVNVRFLKSVLNRYSADFQYIGKEESITITHTSRKADERRDCMKKESSFVCGPHPSTSSAERSSSTHERQKEYLPDEDVIEILIEKVKICFSKSDCVALEEILLLLNSCKKSQISRLKSECKTMYNLLCLHLPPHHLNLIHSQIKDEANDSLKGETDIVPCLISKVLRALRKHPADVFIDDAKFLEIISESKNDSDFVIVHSSGNSPIVSLKRKCLRPHPKWFTEFERSILQLIPDDWTVIALNTLFQKIWAMNLQREQRIFIFSFVPSGDITSHPIHIQYFKRFILQYPCLFSLDGDEIRKSRGNPINDHQLHGENIAIQTSPRLTSDVPHPRSSSSMTNNRKRSCSKDSVDTSSPPHKQRAIEEIATANLIMEKVNLMKVHIQQYGLDLLVRDKEIFLPDLCSEIMRKIFQKEEQSFLSANRSEFQQNISKILFRCHLFQPMDLPHVQAIQMTLKDDVCVTRHITNLTRYVCSIYVALLILLSTY